MLPSRAFLRFGSHRKDTLFWLILDYLILAFFDLRHQPFLATLPKKLMFDKLEVNKGMLVENIVAQMLRSTGNELYFYSHPSRIADDRMEIDFLVRKPSVTSRHNISPIEVKSSSRYTLSSLTKCLSKFGEYLSTPYVLHSSDLMEKNGVTYLPLYMALCL